VIKKPLVSVVIPVYNAGKFLKPTIESILKQTYRNFELILVDDGATDGSGIICDKFAIKYKNINVIHEKNSGISVARNTGIANSKGFFIAFCDHDDEYSPNYLEKAIQSMCNSNVDLLKFNYKTIEVTQNKKIESIIKGNLGRMRISQVLQNYSAFNQCIRALWNGLYKADIIKKNKIFFDPFYKTGVEDYDFNLKYLRQCKMIQFTDDTLFFHYKRENQSADTYFSENKLLSWIKMQEKEQEFLINSKVDDCMLLESKINYLTSILNCLNLRECNWSMQRKVLFLRNYTDNQKNTINISKKAYQRFRKENFLKWFVIYLFNKGLFTQCLYYISFKFFVWKIIHKKR
jgi:glycosyltransferase involved in cell wall biosynthesis